MNFRAGEIAEIIYMDECGELTQRHIRVISVKKGRLLAYCYSRRRIRCFKMENIFGTKKVIARGQEVVCR